MNERDSSSTTGVPRLLDQYKQRRQAWLAQADELVRLRDEARLAAEREALEIVTAARRDVRRIVVQARRDLLVLTAQLHAAVESVEQASAHNAHEVHVLGLDEGPRHDVATDTSLGATREVVLGARREVRSVLDEARAEIEALAVEAGGPLHTLAPAAEPPLPTLDAILAEGSSAAHFSQRHTRSAIALDSFSPPVPSPVVDVPLAESFLDDPSSAVAPQAPYEPMAHEAVAQDAMATAETQPVPAPLADLASSLEAAYRSVERPMASPAPLEAEPGTEPIPSFSRGPSIELIDERDATLAAFGDTGPVEISGPPRVFLAEHNDSHSSSARLWVSLFAATGILAIGGSIWWLTSRRTDGPIAPPAATAAAPARVPAPAAVQTATVPPGLTVEVRRTAWIRTIVDGKEDSRVYKAGETRQILGAKSVSLRAGDAGAVFVSVEGRPAEALGESGTAATKQFALGQDARVVPAVATAPGSNPPTAIGVSSPQPRGDAPPAQPAPAPATNAAEAGRSVPATAANAPSPAAASAAAAPSSANAAGGVEAGPGGRADLVSAGQQWLDAYQRRDREAMTSTGTETTSISDERAITERFPAWQSGVRRDLDQVELELTGDTALLTARMVERSGDPATSAQHISRVSQIWVRRSGRWRLADVRIIGEARLNQIVR